MTSRFGFGASGASPPRVWKKCGHERAPENTCNVSAAKPGGQCKRCNRAAEARYEASPKGLAKRERFRKKRGALLNRRVRPRRFLTPDERQGAQARKSWTRRGVDPTFTYADYLRLLFEQGNCCALCGRPPRKRRLDADHDLNDPRGRVRGLVHFDCNRLIGYFEAGRLKSRRLRARCESYLAGQEPVVLLSGSRLQSVMSA